MRHVICLIVIFNFLSGCGVHVDYPFEVIEGSPLNHAGYEQLMEGRTTKEKATSIMGNEYVVSIGASGVERFLYKYVRERKSTYEVSGVPHSVYTQRVTENISLKFRNGILIQKDKFYKIDEE